MLRKLQKAEKTPCLVAECECHHRHNAAKITKSARKRSGVKSVDFTPDSLNQQASTCSVLLHVVVAGKRDVIVGIGVELQRQEAQDPEDVRSAVADKSHVNRTDDRIALPAQEPDGCGEQGEYAGNHAESEHEGALVVHVIAGKLEELHTGEPDADDERKAEEERDDEEQSVHLHVSCEARKRNGESKPFASIHPEPQSQKLKLLLEKLISGGSGSRKAKKRFTL